jgi:fumarate reductase iron-sulfur subunit
MTIFLKRDGSLELSSFELPFDNVMLSDALIYIKENIDHSLTFLLGCSSGICGICSVNLNNSPVLACKTIIKHNDIISPICRVDIIRDMITENIRPIDISLNPKPNYKASNSIDPQSDCILCNSCYSVCPVIDTNKNFLGPFSLTKSWRYIADSRENNQTQKIANIQKDGVWDCVLCGECARVCPVGINSKNDISILQSKSISFGHTNPNNNFAFGFTDFNFGGFS